MGCAAVVSPIAVIRTSCLQIMSLAHAHVSSAQTKSLSRRKGRALAVRRDMAGRGLHGAQAGQQVAARLQLQRRRRVQPLQAAACRVSARPSFTVAHISQPTEANNHTYPLRQVSVVEAADNPTS